MANKKSLLEQYDIRVENLDFEFVQRCGSAKRVEQILTILRSGEEGFYPELTEFTEKQLRRLEPQSKLLRTVSALVSSSDPKSQADIEELEVNVCINVIAHVSKYYS